MFFVLIACMIVFAHSTNIVVTIIMIGQKDIESITFFDEFSFTLQRKTFLSVINIFKSFRMYFIDK